MFPTAVNVLYYVQSEKKTKKKKYFAEWIEYSIKNIRGYFKAIPRDFVIAFLLI